MTNSNLPYPLILIHNLKLRAEKLEPPYQFRYPLTDLRQIPNSQENIPLRPYILDYHLDLVRYDFERLLSEALVVQSHGNECIEPIGYERTEFFRGCVIAVVVVYQEGQAGTIKTPGNKAEKGKKCVRQQDDLD